MHLRLLPFGLSPRGVRNASETLETTFCAEESSPDVHDWFLSFSSSLSSLGIRMHIGRLRMSEERQEEEDVFLPCCFVVCTRYLVRDCCRMHF